MITQKSTSNGICDTNEWLQSSMTRNHRKIQNYCAWFQVELTSTWNPRTPCTHGKVKTETYPRIASGRQHGGHKITTLPKTPMVLFYIGGYLD